MTIEMLANRSPQLVSPNFFSLLSVQIVGSNPEEKQKMFGRHFDINDELVSHISSRSIDILEANYKVTSCLLIIVKSTQCTLCHHTNIIIIIDHTIFYLRWNTGLFFFFLTCVPPLARSSQSFPSIARDRTLVCPMTGICLAMIQ